MPNLEKIQRVLEPCDLGIWQMTLKNNRAPLLSNIKLCSSFHHHMWSQTGVTVRKRLSWVLTSVTLTFDLWPWLFAWTSLLSLVITPENFMMIRWWEHSQKGVTDRQTDRQTDRKYHSLSCLVTAKSTAEIKTNIENFCLVLLSGFSETFLDLIMNRIHYFTSLHSAFCKNTMTGKYKWGRILNSTCIESQLGIVKNDNHFLNSKSNYDKMKITSTKVNLIKYIASCISFKLTGVSLCPFPYIYTLIQCPRYPLLLCESISDLMSVSSDNILS